VALVVVTLLLGTAAAERGDGVELLVDDSGGGSVTVPLLTDGGPPAPPVTWHRARTAGTDPRVWRLRVRVLPVDDRRTLTVRVIGEVDADGVPVAEPVSFTCLGGFGGADVSCASDGDGRYDVRWPRSWGPYASISTDLAVGGELRSTSWAVQMSDLDAGG
jgi:hypothetical protein